MSRRVNSRSPGLTVSPFKRMDLGNDADGRRCDASIRKARTIGQDARDLQRLPIVLRDRWFRNELKVFSGCLAKRSVAFSVGEAWKVRSRYAQPKVPVLSDSEFAR